MERERAKVKHTGIGAQLEAQLSCNLGTGSGRSVETVEIESGRAGCPLFDFLDKPQNHSRHRGRITARRQSAQPNSKNCKTKFKEKKKKKTLNITKSRPKSRKSKSSIFGSSY